MNNMPVWDELTRELGQSDVVQRLGWMLLHSIWQGAAGAFVLWIFLLMTRGVRGGRWPGVRYIIACGMMLAVVVASAVTFVRSISPAPTLVASRNVLTVSENSNPDIVLFLNQIDHPIPPVPAKFDPHSLIPITVCIWAIGVTIQSLWQCAGWMRLRRLRRGIAISDLVWIDMLRQTSARLGIRRMVGLVVGAIDVPAVIGAFRPVIIIPLALVNELTPQQMQAILAHELAHIRRWDYAVNLVQTAVETLFFYHPAIWFISAQIRRERENCCDDIAADLCGDARKYAGALIRLEERRSDLPRLSLAATDGSLVERVRRLLAVPSPGGGRARSILIAAIGLVCVVVPIGWQRTTRAQMAHPSTQSAAQIPSTQPADQSAHIIAVGDVLLVGVKDLQGEGTGQDLQIIRVSASGDIGLRYIRPMHAEGLNDQQIHDAVVKAYSDTKLIQNPQVSITVDARDSEAEYSDISNQLKRARAQLTEDQAALSQKTQQGDQQGAIQALGEDLRVRVRELQQLEDLFQAETPGRLKIATRPGDSELSPDEIDYLVQLQNRDPVVKMSLNERSYAIIQLHQLKDEGKDDVNPDVLRARRGIADSEERLRQSLATYRAHDQEAAKAASGIGNIDSTLTPDDLELAGDLQDRDIDMRQLLNDRKKYIDLLQRLKAEGYGDTHATVKSTRLLLAGIEDQLKRKIDDARANPPPKPSYVHITVSKGGVISIDGNPGTWETLRDQLNAMNSANRGLTVLTIAADNAELPVGDFFMAQGRAIELAKELKLASVSMVGMAAPDAAAGAAKPPN